MSEPVEKKCPVTGKFHRYQQAGGEDYGSAKCKDCHRYCPHPAWTDDTYCIWCGADGRA